MATCTGTTKKGTKCRQTATGSIPDPDRCGRHPRQAPQVRGANAVAVELTLGALEADLNEVDAALAAAARSLAAAVDQNPMYPNLWSRYLECLRLLMDDGEIDEEARETFEKYAA